jgi:NAD(P)-dependent dehydrogenase (short-subunit alcohol dehydrogenase family)
LGAAIAAVIERFGQLNFLVNSAASFIAAGLEATESDWDRALSVNIKGYAGTVSKASRHMGEGSAIVNVASISAHIAQRNRWTYNATKAAIVEMTKCQALDLAPQGIRVNTVSPGWIWTAEVAKAANGDRARWEPVWGDYHILRRLGEPSEVASAITFLLSDAASFITASELMVDGGYSALSAEGLGTASLFASSR